MAKRLEARSGAILEANKNDIDAARGKGRDDAFVDRLALNEARVAAMAKRLARHRRAAGSGRRGDRVVDAAERLADRARARAAGRDRHHL